MSRMRYWLPPLLVLILWSLGLCDDCSSPQDAMDTWWVGPPVEGLVGAVIVGVVNGETIINTIFNKPPAEGGEGDEEDEDPPEYTLDVTTQDHQTELMLDSDEGLWVYAAVRVINPPPGYSPMDDLASVSFSGPPQLSISAPQMRGQTKAVMVKAVTPPDGSEPKSATLTVSATLGGNPMSLPVNFTISGGYKLVVTTRSEWSGV
jgi:hypothetical protein